MLFVAPATTTKVSLLHNPQGFLEILLDGVTVAGLLFIVASGFTLIFGLMRVVNMAHGAFFLFGGYIPLTFESRFVGGGASALGGGLDPSQVGTASWIFPLLIGAAIVGLAGLGDQRLHNQQLHIFLRETDTPQFHHIGLDVDDFEAVYLNAKERGLLELNTWYSQIWEHPATSLAR